MSLARATSMVCSLAFFVGVAEMHAQMDPENVPEPPVERLAKLQPFVGLYAHTGQFYGGVGPFNGTLEVGPAVKGWYVEFVINTHHRAIDRQLRMIMTWDDELQHYRVWRFSTLPQQPPGTVEGKARFVGDTLVMEWENMRSPQGREATFRNRVFMDGPDELVILSDAKPEGAARPIQIGEWRSKRRI